MMLLVSLLQELIKTCYLSLIFQKKEKHLDLPQCTTNPSPSNNEATFFWKIKKVIIYSLKLTLCFTVFFGCFQFTLSDDGFLLLRNDPQDNLPMSTSRSLQQISSTENLMISLNSLNFNPGEILASTSESNNVKRMLVSKDGKTLFTLGNERFTILNISNPKEVRRISELEVKTDSDLILLSPDQQTVTLFGEGRQLINVSNLSSPILMERVSKLDMRSPSLSVTLSSNGKFLYCLTWGYLDVFNATSLDPIIPLGGDLAGKIAISNDNSKMITTGGNVNGMSILPWLWDWTNPTSSKMNSIGTFQGIQGDVIETAFSSDGTKAFLVVNKDSQMYFHVFDITNTTDVRKIRTTGGMISRPVFPIIFSTNLGPADKLLQSFWFSENKDFGFYFTINQFRILRLTDMEQTTLLYLNSPDRSLFRAFAPSLNYQRNAIFIDRTLFIMRFHIDIVPKSLPSFKSNAFKVTEQIDYSRVPAIGLSKDEKTFFLANEKEDRQMRELYSELFPYEKFSNFSFKEQKRIENSFRLTWEASKQDWKYNLIVGKENVVLVKRGPPEATPYILAVNRARQTKSWVHEKPTDGVQSLALTEDGKTIVYITSQKTKLWIVPLQDDYRDPTEKNIERPLEYGSGFSAMKINREGTLVYCANRYLLIYNIQNQAAPVLENSSALNGIQVSELTLSKDEKIIYLVGTSNGQKQLQIFNVSDIKKPQFIKSIPINQTSKAIDTVELSPDERLFYIGFSSGVLVIDVRSLKNPVPLGYYRFPNRVYGLKFANNASLVYTVTSDGVTAFDISERHILYLENSDFKIGGSYQIPLQTLKSSKKNFKFEYIAKKHKFLKVSLLEDGSILSQKTLPIWMTFDKERSLLIVEPNSGSNNGTYKVLVTSSTQTFASVFIGLKNITTEKDAKNLMLNLIQSGYIDTQGYVSENFDPSEKLWIDPTYENIEEDIRSILAQNYIQAIGEFSVSPSLELLKTNYSLAISTLNPNHISVTIQLNRNQEGNPYFLEKTYSNLKPTIMNERSSILLEGSLEDVNKDLKEILIDLDGLKACNGHITIRDGINYPVSENITNISSYFIKNNETISVVNETKLVLSLFDDKNAIVDIHLSAPNNDTNQSPYFIRNSYKYIRYSLNDEQTLLHLEGSLSDINNALQDIIIDLNGFESCKGMVNVTDGKNPLKSRFFENIKTYFIKNNESIIFSDQYPLIISYNSPTTADHLTVTIQFNESESDGRQARFVEQSFKFSRATINRKKSSLLELEGPVDDINKALRDIVVDLGQRNNSECAGGTVTIKDGANPPISRYNEALSKHFRINKAPLYDNSLQAQIDDQPFYTGLYSMLELNESTFTDANNLSLSYDLEMPTHGEQVPSWINFRGLTLSLMVTLPEKIKPWSYEFKLVVKNEFKNITVPFTLRNNISLMYGLKEASTWLGKIGTILGLWLSRFKIYNLLFGKSKRYPRSYKLKLGEEITDSKIFPISFIKEEMKESQKIFSELEKHICNKKYDSLFDYFVNSQTNKFDKEKIVSTLQELENKSYNAADSFSQGIIHQLIINKIVMKQLKSKQEIETLRAFDKIKNEWMDLVAIEPKSPSSPPEVPPEFIIKLDKLEQKLSRLAPYQKDNDETQHSFLLTENMYNLDLLANAIIAHAFDFQNLDIETIELDVISYKKLKGNSLWTLTKRFFQYDLKPFAFLNKQKIGYGIKYKIHKNTLHFIGRLAHDLKDDTIVIQLKKDGKKILREIWLTQENQDIQDHEESYIENISETL